MQHTKISNQYRVDECMIKDASENLGEHKIKIMGLALVWVAGLVLAGSDGPLMPYLNIAGATVFFMTSIWLARCLPCLDPDNPHLAPDNKVEKNSAVTTTAVPVQHKGKQHDVKYGVCFCTALTQRHSCPRLLS